MSSTLPAATPMFSSELFRERDKALEQKHSKEISALESRLAKLKYRNDDLVKQLYEARHRGDHLAMSLGFTDIYDAQVAIDGADHETKYTQCVQRMVDAEARLLAVTEENDALRGIATEAMSRLADMSTSRLHDSDLAEELRRKDADLATLKGALERAKGEVESLQKRLDRLGDKSTSRRSNQAQELAHLLSRYDQLFSVYRKSAERALKDWTNYKLLRHWLFVEDGLLDYKGSNDPKFKEQVRSMVGKKLKKILEAGPEKFPLPQEPTLPDPEMWKQGGAISRLDKLEVNKENAPSPILSSKHRKEPPETQQKLTSTLMTRTNTQKTPLVDSRNPAQLSALSAPSTHESMLVVPAPIKVPGSSDTEEDSQAISHLSSPLATPLFKPPYPPTSATVVQRRSGGSSDTEEDSQMPSSPSLTPAPAHINSTPAWTASPRLDVVSSLPPQRTRRREELAPFSQFDDVTPRPTKIRRTFAHEDPSHVGIFSSLDTPETKNPAGVIDRSRKNILELLIGSGKGKEKAPLEANTPSPLSIKDRSKGIVFSAPPGVRVKDVKGPGSSKSTNLARSLFAINPERNGGLDFQFEDVIRSRDDRRRLDAGDCECCREVSHSLFKGRMHALQGYK
ncbi:hypothetical protein HGRIS_014352 [Hohenbuehelia grisea]|uniref:Uncharacterized protein n=1 Tax=Hohenbuehelia grisea TaxID=104357 RepID=A0ABR3JV36_9AGAR